MWVLCSVFAVILFWYPFSKHKLLYFDFYVSNLQTIFKNWCFIFKQGRYSSYDDEEGTDEDETDDFDVKRTQYELDIEQSYIEAERQRFEHDSNLRKQVIFKTFYHSLYLGKTIYIFFGYVSYLAFKSQRIVCLVSSTIQWW